MTDPVREAFAHFAAGDDLRGEWSRLAFEAGYAAGAKAEREVCAKVCEDRARIHERVGQDAARRECEADAAAIRARGEKGE